MASLEQELLPGEWFIFSGRAHWIRYVAPAVPVVLGAFLLQAHYVATAAFVWVLAVAIALPLILEALRSQFIVTNQRVILKRGIFQQTTESVPLADITAIELYLDGIGGLLKAGRIRLDTVDGQQRSLPWMNRARTFRRLALEQQKVARLPDGGRGPTSLPGKDSQATRSDRAG
jgi:uncharacterized membrane protein YdbT with pleckstrin-like domain